MNHGYACYTNGCRCAVCREAKRVYQAARRAAGLEAMRVGEVPRPAWHDAAPQQRNAPSLRVGLRRIQLPNVTHGTETGYRRGCRCWDCTDVATAADRARKQRRRKSA